jgi:hypothetical protein
LLLSISAPVLEAGKFLNFETKKEKVKKIKPTLKYKYKYK